MKEAIKMKIIEMKTLYIETTQNQRTIQILLPENYQESDQRYRVLYMHDGQNLFDDKSASSNLSWGIPETILQLVDKNLIDDLIVVGIDNSDQRHFEYSPWVCSEYVTQMSGSEVGGLGDIYADFIVHTLKPFIDSNYRTLPNYENTMIAGSSMGAYISTYIAIKYPRVFQYVGVFSVASWFNENAFLDFLRKSSIDVNQKYFISIGSNETSNSSIKDFNEIYLNNSRNLLDLLKEKEILDILYIETDDIHHESAWKKVFPDFIRFTNNIISK